MVARISIAGSFAPHPVEDHAERPRIAADVGHQIHRINIGSHSISREYDDCRTVLAPNTMAPPPTKSPSSMPKTNESPAPCRTERSRRGAPMADRCR